MSIKEQQLFSKTPPRIAFVKINFGFYDVKTTVNTNPKQNSPMFVVTTGTN